MSQKSAITTLYREFLKATQNCSDLHLKAYVRRRIKEDITLNRNA